MLLPDGITQDPGVVIDLPTIRRRVRISNITMDAIR